MIKGMVRGGTHVTKHPMNVSVIPDHLVLGQLEMTRDVFRLLGQLRAPSAFGQGFDERRHLLGDLLALVHQPGDRVAHPEQLRGAVQQLGRQQTVALNLGHLEGSASLIMQ